MTPIEVVVDRARKYRDAYRIYEQFHKSCGGDLEKVNVRRAREALFEALEALP